MLTLAQLGDRTSRPVRRLQYVCDHAVVPRVSGKGQGFGVAPTFTGVEAFGVAAAAYLLQAGCARRMVAAALQVACTPGRRAADAPLARAWLAAAASLEMGDGYVVRLLCRSRPGGTDDLDTGWLPLHPRGLRLRLLNPVVLKRSMGDQKRMAGRAVRNLNDGDYRGDKRVAVTNPPDDRIRAPATFASVVPPAEQAVIVAVLDERSRHLKGKPRARGGAANPLGGRIYDMACGWPMYRNMKRKVWCYTCGMDMNSDARCCSHNLVRGEAATRFTLAAIRQRVFPAGVYEKLKARLTALSHNEVGGDPTAGERAALERELAASRHKKDTIGHNLSLAESPEQFRVISQTFEEAGREVQRLDDRLRSLPTADRSADPAAEVASALAVLGRLTEFAAAATPAAVGVGELIRGVDARLYLRFDRGRAGPAGDQRGRRGHRHVRVDPATSAAVRGEK